MTDLIEDARPADPTPAPGASSRAPRQRLLPNGSRPMSAGRAFVVGALSFALAALLNSETLHDMAERQPYGWKRDVALGLAAPLHTVSGWLLLDRPGEWVDEARGLNQDAPIDLGELVAGTTVPPPTAGGDAPGTTAGPAAPGDPAAPTSTPGPGDPPPTTAPAPPPTVPPPPTVRAATAEDPLRVLVMGDSLAQGFGQTFERYVTDTGFMTPSASYRTSSGLTRPDYFDWPAEIVRKTTEVNPDVVVLMFGGNDAQKLDIGGTIYDVDEGPWQDEYRRRVGTVMDYIVGGGRRLVWVGLPPMEGSFDQRTQILDRIYREEAAKRPAVSFVDARPLFTGPSGGYDAYLPNDQGEQKLMRTQDGVHFSLAGAQRLAGAVLDTVKALVPQPGGGQPAAAGGTAPAGTNPTTAPPTVPTTTVPATTAAAPTTVPATTAPATTATAAPTTAAAATVAPATSATPSTAVSAP